MPNTIRCDECDATIRLKRDTQAGDVIRCAKCDTKNRVYEEDLDEVDNQDDAPRQSRGKSASRKKGSGTPVWIWVVVGAILLTCAGTGTLIYRAYVKVAENPLMRAAMGVPGLTETNLKKLKVGMPEAEIVDLFGKPNSSHEQPNQKLILPGPAGPGPVTKRVLIWLGQGGALTAEFHNGLLAMGVGQVGEFRHVVQ